MTRKKKKTLNMGSRQKKAYSALNKRLAMYTDLVREIIEDFASEASRSAQSTGYTKGEKPFAFSDYPETRHAVTRMKQNFVNNMSSIIYNGVSQEWRESNLYQDMLAEDFIRETNVVIDGQKRSHYYETDNGALKAFRRRQDKGLKLSTNIWNQAKDMQTELEATLSCALEKGMDAVTLSKRVSKYLRDYDKIKKDYKELYGKAVNIHDCEYRSMRLARSEINMAYRSAENARWQDMDFVIGMEIKTSNNHPDADVCNELAGKYPKDFDWVGWHPNCRCFKIPILKKPSEAFDEDGESKPSPEEVKDMPDNFKKWVRSNEKRILAARDHGTEPYFIRDNRKAVDGILNKKKIDDIAKERHANRTPEKEKMLREYWNAKVAEGVEHRKRQAVLDAATVRHAARTPEQIADIKQRAQERQKKHTLIKKTANNILNVAKEYAEVDFSALEKYVKEGNLDAMKYQTKIVAKKIVEVKADEKFLSALIPDAHNWHKQFTSKELHEVFDAVESKLNEWAPLTLEQQEKKLKFEWNDFLGGNMHNVQSKYKTWRVSQAAYKKKHAEILDAIDWQGIGNVLSEAKTFKTKSKPYLDLISRLESAISAKDKANAQSIVTDMKLKREALKKAAAARAAKRYGKSADGLYIGGNPFDADELTKLKDYETKIIGDIMNGSVDDELIKQYHDYTLKLSEKYYNKQASLFSEAECEVMKKSTERYLARPSKNPHFIWGTDLGGVYEKHDNKIKAYLPRLQGITEEELSIVKRFTNGSTFSNAYNLRHSSPFWEEKWKEKMGRLTPLEIKEMEQVVEEWSQGANYALDRMVRYNGVTFRGLDKGGGPELRANLTKAFNSGKPWVNEASCSTSMKHKVAVEFDGDIILIIHNKTGAYIHAISDYNAEFEVMTLRGAKYKVVVPPKRVGSRYYAELEEIV